jgi:hypothetical protein
VKSGGQKPSGAAAPPTGREFKIICDHLISLVAAPSGAPASAPQLGSSPAPNSPANPFDAFGGMGGMGLGGGNLQQMQSQLMQNPELMQQMLNSPMMESLLSNPEMMTNMMLNNPMLQPMLDANPQIRHILRDPSVSSLFPANSSFLLIILRLFPSLIFGCS